MKILFRPQQVPVSSKIYSSINIFHFNCLNSKNLNDTMLNTFTKCQVFCGNVLSSFISSSMSISDIVRCVHVNNTNTIIIKIASKDLRYNT